MGLEGKKSAIKMIKRMGRERVKKRGKYEGMWEERISGGGA